MGFKFRDVVEGEGDLFVDPSCADVPHQVSHRILPRYYVNARSQEHQESLIMRVVQPLSL